MIIMPFPVSDINNIDFFTLPYDLGYAYFVVGGESAAKEYIYQNPVIISKFIQVYGAFNRANQRRVLSGVKSHYVLPYVSIASYLTGSENIALSYDQCVAMYRQMVLAKTTNSVMTYFMNMCLSIHNEMKSVSRLIGNGKPSSCVSCDRLPLIQNKQAIANGNGTDAFKYVADLLEQRGTLCNTNGQFYNLFCRTQSSF